MRRANELDDFSRLRMMHHMMPNRGGEIEHFSPTLSSRGARLRGGFVDREQGFSNVDEVFVDNTMNMSPAYGLVVEKPPSLFDRDEAIRRRYLGNGVSFDYEYDGAQDHNVGPQRVVRSVQQQHRETRTTRVQPQQSRLGDEVDRYPDPYLFDKLSAMEREERTRFHTKDDALRYVEPALRSKDVVSSSSRGISRMSYANVVEDDMRLPEISLSRSSSKLRQPLYEYGEDHVYRAVGDKGLRGVKYDINSPPMGDRMDYLYPNARSRDAGDYAHSHERTSFLERAALEKRYAGSSVLSQTVREDVNDTEFPRRDVVNSSSWDRGILNKQSVPVNFLDGRSSQGRFYMDTNVDTQHVRESGVQGLDVPHHGGIPQRKLVYHGGKDGHYNSYGERYRRSPEYEHEMEMLGDRYGLEKMESCGIDYDGHPIRSLKRKYILDEETIGRASRPVVFRKQTKNITRNQEIDLRNEVWDDQDASDLLLPDSFEDDRCFGRTEWAYNRELEGRGAASDDLLSYRFSSNPGQKHVTRPYCLVKKPKVHGNHSSLGHYDTNQFNRKLYLKKNVWVRGKDDKQTESCDHVVEELKNLEACAEAEFPEDSPEFKRLVHDFFLISTKKLNESVSTQKRYKELGRAGGLYCIVCAKSQSKEFKDTRCLATHCYMSQKAGLRAKHLGLHKAICVLMGWNSDGPPVGKLWVAVDVPAPNALADKEDLILWPPVVVIHNCSALVTGPDGQKVMTAEVVEDFLRGKGFSGGRIKVSLGKPANGSIFLVKFLGTLPGLQDAEKLHNYFMGEERGRKDFEALASTKGKGINRRNMIGDEVEELLLYGYMAIAEDLDEVDNDTKRKCLIKSRKEIHDFVDAPVRSPSGD